jgi:hypothetical protein
MDEVKKTMEIKIISLLAKELHKSEKEALEIFYRSRTYKWFCDDYNYGIAREGSEAIFVRVLSEYNGKLLY